MLLREPSATRYHSFLELDTMVEACLFHAQGPSSGARDDEMDATHFGDASLGTRVAVTTHRKTAGCACWLAAVS